jgi:hypothetical protein
MLPQAAPTRFSARDGRSPRKIFHRALRVATTAIFASCSDAPHGAKRVDSVHEEDEVGAQRSSFIIYQLIDKYWLSILTSARSRALLAARTRSETQSTQPLRGSRTGLLAGAEMRCRRPNNPQKNARDYFGCWNSTGTRLI